MLAEPRPPKAASEDLARECLYRLLAAVVSGPCADGWDRVLDPQARDVVRLAAGLLHAPSGAVASPDEPGACSLVVPAFTRLIRELDTPPAEHRAEYDRVFGLLVPRECPPYETEYYPTAEPFARSQQMADAAGFYRAFGVEPSRRSPERPDHLGLQLEFMAFVLLKKRLATAPLGPDPDAAGRVETCDRAQRDFFRDHLAWWVPSFAAGLRRKAGRGCYLALADVLAAWIPAECRRLEIPAVLRPVRPDLIEPSDEQSGCITCPLSS